VVDNIARAGRRLGPRPRGLPAGTSPQVIHRLSKAITPQIPTG